MELRRLQSVQKKLIEFVDEFKFILGRKERGHWCQYYLSGLMLNGERKSIQPMAERLPGGNEQALQQFVNQSPWDYQSTQRHLLNFLRQKTRCHQGVLVLDDTTFPKKGTASVGVARQYCGALGKVSNCQSLVTWHYSSANEIHFPLLGELYLPQEWINDPKRLKRCSVPKERFEFKKKWELALTLLDKLVAEKLAHEAIVFDAGYGEIKEFLNVLDARGETFVGQIPQSHHYWPVDIACKQKRATTGRPRLYPEIEDKTQKARSAKDWGIHLLSNGMKWKRIKLNLKSKRSTEVMAVRVREVNAQWYWRPGPERCLVIEKIGRGNQCKYYLSNASADTSLTQLMKWAHERWKIEQGYQQLKEELGLDHFEGRSFLGLNHHITLCFMAYAFLLLLKTNRLKKNVNASSNTTVAKPVIPDCLLSSLSPLS